MKAAWVILVILGGNPIAPRADERATERYLTATLTVAQPHFDGREFSGVLTVCADEDGVFVDQRLSTETFDVADVTDCVTGRRVSYYPVEGGVAAGQPKMMPLLRDTCVGRRVKWRLFRLPDPSQSGCLDLTLRGAMRSADGKTIEVVSTSVRVQP